jgi:hypothetical protein
LDLFFQFAIQFVLFLASFQKNKQMLFFVTVGLVFAACLQMIDAASRSTGASAQSMSLRTEQAVDVSQIVKESGFMEYVWYDDGACSHPNQKWVYMLNYCGPYFYQPGTWMTIAVNTDPQTHNYYQYNSSYSDSACSFMTGTQEVDERVLICKASTWGTTDSYLVHVIDEPLNLKKDNLDYAVSIYASQSNCYANGKTGIIEAEYVNFGACTGWNGFDLMINSCDANGLYGFTFTSQDFQCGGTPTPVTIATSDVCTTPTNDIVGYYSGYTNIVCAPNPSETR